MLKMVPILLSILEYSLLYFVYKEAGPGTAVLAFIILLKQNANAVKILQHELSLSMVFTTLLGLQKGDEVVEEAPKRVN